MPISNAQEVVTTQKKYCTLNIVFVFCRSAYSLNLRYKKPRYPIAPYNIQWRGASRSARALALARTLANQAPSCTTSAVRAAPPVRVRRVRRCPLCCCCATATRYTPRRRGCCTRRSGGVPRRQKKRKGKGRTAPARSWTPGAPPSCQPPSLLAPRHPGAMRSHALNAKPR